MKLHDFMLDPQLSPEELQGPSWSTWRVIARLYDGDADLLTDAERELAKRLTGRSTFTAEPPSELYVAAGRRSGKTRFASLLAVQAAAQDYTAKLAAGESAVVAAVAPDRRQAGLLVDYCRGFIESSPLLRNEIARETSDSIEFTHRTRIEVHTGSFRAVRGYSMALAVIDEAAFLRSEESAVPDIELARALRPALLTLGGRLVVISSPHRKVGLLWNAFRAYHGDEAQPA